MPRATPRSLAARLLACVVAAFLVSTVALAPLSLARAAHRHAAARAFAALSSAHRDVLTRGERIERHPAAAAALRDHAAPPWHVSLPAPVPLVAPAAFVDAPTLAVDSPFVAALSRPTLRARGPPAV